jgi:hypothetical protein
MARLERETISIDSGESATCQCTLFLRSRLASVPATSTFRRRSFSLVSFTAESSIARVLFLALFAPDRRGDSNLKAISPTKDRYFVCE